MARIKLDLPESFSFSTRMPIRITDLNYGNHLGNNQILGMIHEARVRFLNTFNCTEKDVFGVGLVVSDSVIVYKNQGFYNNILIFESAITDVHKRGCDFFFRITDESSGREIARAKTGILFFDYEKQKLASTPEKFKEMFGS